MIAGGGVAELQRVFVIAGSGVAKLQRVFVIAGRSVTALRSLCDCRWWCGQVTQCL